MLFNNNSKYDKDDVVSFKLVNGDELIAKIVETSMTGWIVNRPCTVVPSAQGIGLIQSLFTGDINKNIELRTDHVMIHSVTIKEMENHYIQTTTGIAPVNGGSIIK
jgi:hypothetical protein